ncbi:AAA domain-containing protein [Pseudovibrio sp. POLY-S9]|uniref:AAA domain-containing protein n=1 Tax=Pseudovibrio sp. POLY-S9 TaxID=1576596 RepID=UPI00070C4B1A|nr:AAA domain-containing protein [Pseudovibrio sp. POLY-S9]
MSELIDYWISSLRDMEYCAPDIKKGVNVPIKWDSAKGGVLPLSLCEELFTVADRKVQRRQPGEPMLEELAVMIAPFSFRRAVLGQRPKVFAPIWITASVDREGRLATDTETPPFLVRDMLSPNANADVLIGEAAAQESFHKSHKFMLTQGGWSEQVRYMNELWENVNGRPLEAILNDNKNTGILSLRAAEVQGIARNLAENLKGFKQVASEQRGKTSLQAFIDLKSSGVQALDGYSKDALARHCGHIAKEFGLSPSQREAQAQVSALNTGQVLAIEGPPGTGKTTLMQSVLANGIVEAALRGKDPFVVLACSVNNQAVLNLNQSLAEAANSSDVSTLSKRWLPSPRKVLSTDVAVDTLGTYLASEGQVENVDVNQVLTMTLEIDGNKRRWCGGHTLFESREYFQAAKSHFLEAAEATFSKSFESVTDVKLALHQRLKRLDTQLKAFSAECSVISTLAKKYGSDCASVVEEIDERLRHCQWNEAAPVVEGLEETKSAKERHISHELYAGRELLNTAGFLDRLFPRRRVSRSAKFFREHEAFDIANALLDCRKPIDAEEFLDQQIAAQKTECNKLESQIRDLDVYRFEFEGLQTDKKQFQASMERLKGLLLKLGIEGQKFIEMPDWFQSSKTQDLLDRVLRRDMFMLACRYWEARWLEEMAQYLPKVEAERSKKGGINANSGEKTVKERLHRYAMLTPCFVATFFQAAKFFNLRRGKSGGFKLEPLWGFCDLIIVDEAGQSAPHIGAAPFGLAKAAVCIGDVKQIKPVSKLPDFVDLGNIEACGLTEAFADLAGGGQEGQVEDCGFRAGTGSLMAAAMAVSCYNREGGSGMFLREHRRCYDDIISYCNDAFYSGQMEPLKGTAPRDKGMLPPLGYAHIQGRANKQGGSWANPSEASAIAQWISENREVLLKQANLPEGRLSEAVALISPFKSQAQAIKSALAKQGIKDDITVGTVHALQGAERPIVIFSTTYSANASKKVNSLFFDSDASILNVAVSRAKLSFLVFGDMNIMNPLAQNASSILARRLFDDPQNEIKNIDAAPKLTTLPGMMPERIETLQQFQSILRRAFEQAQNRLLVVSPFLSRAAIEEDNVIELYHAAVKRGVDVRIVYDVLKEANNQWFVDGRKLLEDSGVKLIAAHNVHNKTLCVDHDFIVEGSFNWLSANRQTFSQQERAFLLRGAEVSQMIDEVWAEYNESTFA